MNLQVKVCEKAAGTCFTQKQLEDIARSLVVVMPSFPPAVKAVYFGEYAPHDLSLPWQKTDPAGTPIGKIKYYRNGRWQ